MTRSEIEAALDSGRLFVRRTSGNAWRCRRNGKTRLWKRDPSRFYIPAKAGLRDAFAITETDLSNFASYFEIRD